MILSMTGYGKGTSNNKSLQADVEVKSVNSRYLEIYLKIPQIISNKEYDLRELIKSKIKRGKINLSVQLKRNGVDEESISVDEDKLKKYLAVIKKVKKTAKLSDKIKLDHILLSKDIFTNGVEELSEIDFNVIKESVGEALDNLVLMKRREGSELEKDLKKRLKSIEKKLDDIEKESVSSVSEHNLKYREKLNVCLMIKVL